MQFELAHKVGEHTISVQFTGHLYRLPQAACLSLLISFKRLGGKIDNSNSCLFIFPAFITSQIISEIIKNTCFKCGGLMKDGEAIVNNKMYVQKDQGQIEYNNPESTKFITVRKCTACGHSHT